VQLFDFPNDRLFWFILYFRIKELWIFFQNYRTIGLGYFRNIKEPAVSMKELAKNQQLEKLCFLKFSKKLRTKVLHQNPILDFFFTPAG
jgi:hypothetical protein